MSSYTIEIDRKFHRTLTDIARDKGTDLQGVFSRAIYTYYDVNRILDEADIEREPNTPWKLSITEPDGKGGRRVVKDISLP